MRLPLRAGAWEPSIGRARRRGHHERPRHRPALPRNVPRGSAASARTPRPRVASATPGRRRRRAVAGGGAQLIFKSLDLIPDGIDDLGFLDDAFVLRVACAPSRRATRRSSRALVAAPGRGARAVRDFLGDDYARLETYVSGLRKGAAPRAHGRRHRHRRAHARHLHSRSGAWSAATRCPASRGIQDPGKVEGVPQRQAGLGTFSASPACGSRFSVPARPGSGRA